MTSKDGSRNERVKMGGSQVKQINQAINKKTAPQRNRDTAQMKT